MNEIVLNSANENAILIPQGAYGDTLSRLSIYVNWLNGVGTNLLSRPTAITC